MSTYDTHSFSITDFFFHFQSRVHLEYRWYRDHFFLPIIRFLLSEAQGLERSLFSHKTQDSNHNMVDLLK